MVGPIMNLISGTHHQCERKEYAFMILREYTIIFPIRLILQNQNNTVLWLLNEKGIYLEI